MERDAFTDERDRVLTRKELDKKWAWVLTGSGHFFNETIDLINKLNFVDLFVSKAAEEVLVMYKKKEKYQGRLKYIKTIHPVQLLLESFIKELTTP